MLKNDLKLFTSFFNRAAHTDEEIERKHIKFVELDQMAEYANKMLKDRKRAETLLLESEQKYRQFVETAKEGVWAIDAEQRTTFVNRHMTEMLGYSPEEMLGESVQTFMFEEDLPDHHAKTEQRKQGYGGAFERRYRHKDGGEVWTHASVTAVMDSEGLFTGSYALFTDITERKRIEEALRVSEERLRILFNGINEAVFVHEGPENGIPGSFIVVNDRACERLGYSRNELLTMRPTDIDAPETIPNVPKMMERLCAKGDAVWEGVHISKDGNRIPVEIANCLAHLEGRQIIISTVRDITERKRMEQQLQQSQKMEAIGALAGGIAHDFNNILYPIIGFSEMLMEDLPAGSPDHENAGVIFKAARRAGDLVKQILSFSRQAEHEKIPVRIQQILKEVFKLTRSTIPSNIEISQSIQSDCGLVMADPTQVHQIAMNLITNAYHAIEESGGSISVQLKESVLIGKDWGDTSLEAGKYAVITVSDTGYGIDPAVMGRIFEPYFTTKEVGRGTGLGLSVVHGIVKEHGGDIRVYSEVGKGTAFTVYLPIIKKETDTVSAEALVIHQTGTERILLVDDEEPIVQLEKQMLERLGYHVEERTSSIEALKAFRANPKAFDLVITDMNMPNMAGDKLATKLRSIKPGIPVIICTGFSLKLNEQKAKAMGINGCLMKPVVKSEMAQMVRKVLDEAKR